MLSVRLPESLEYKLTEFCALQNVSKSSVVQRALEKHLRRVPKLAQAAKNDNPFTALRGIGNRQYTTEQMMTMTRGEDWNQA